MAKEYAKGFYNSALWHRTKNSYLKSRNYLCERCLKAGRFEPAKIVHHKKYINPNNIANTNIIIDHANLECLCQECHNKEHHKNNLRYIINDNGEICPP